MASRRELALLWLHTVRHLRPEQVVHRLRLRAQKLALERWPAPFERAWKTPVTHLVGWPESFRPLDAQLEQGFPSAEANAKGHFRFIERERELGSPPDWGQRESEQLWRYHLHYFEWAWSFLRHPNREWARAAFGELWGSWREGTTFGRWDAWSPYVVSLRAWVFCGLFDALVKGTTIEREFLDDVGLHAGFVRRNLELDVGGNHLIKNLKALVGLGVFLGDEALLGAGIDGLLKQLPVQVLPDGGHYERSPSYHCQVLGDLIEVAGLLRSAGRPALPEIDAAIASMRRWLGAMLLPDGDVPLFNDCVLVGADRLALLEPAPPPGRRLTVLQPSGYVVMRPGERLHLVADVGPPCPDELPAHAHADCLSFELCVDGRRVIVDTGTSTYEPGPVRDYERSTRAHNTVETDGENQTEVWGAFRAAHRAHPRLEGTKDDGHEIRVVASHDGYERLPGTPRHRRTWRVRPDQVVIVDEVEGGGRHALTARMHLAPGLAVEAEYTNRLRAGPLLISIEGSAELRVEDSPASFVAGRFGRRGAAHALVAHVDAGLPLRLMTTLVLDRPGSE